MAALMERLNKASEWLASQERSGNCPGNMGALMARKSSISCPPDLEAQGHDLEAQGQGKGKFRKNYDILILRLLIMVSIWTVSKGCHQTLVLARLVDYNIPTISRREHFGLL